MLDGLKYISLNQRQAYQNNENIIYKVNMPANFKGEVIFNPGHCYIVSLPNKIGDCKLYFNFATVFFRGRKHGLCTPLDNVYVRCDNCYVDLSKGMHGIPTQINTDLMMLYGAKYLNITEPCFNFTNPQNDFNRAVINSLLSSKNVLALKDSKLYMGTDVFNIDCQKLLLDNSKILLPYTQGQIKCDEIIAENSTIVDDEGLKLNIASGSLDGLTFEKNASIEDIVGPLDEISFGHGQKVMKRQI